MSAPRTLRAAVLGLLIGLVALAPTSVRAESTQHTRYEGYVGDGLYLRERAHAGPVRSVEVHVQPGADVEFVPALSDGVVGGGREVVSSMCARVGGVVCVNANFTVCPRCSQPFGGVVQDGVLVRSPSPAQDQVSVIGGRLSTTPWDWVAQLVAGEGGEAIGLDGLNRSLGADDIVLYTSRYGASTGAAAGSYEVVVGATQPLVTGAGIRQRVELWHTHTGGDARIPANGFVVSARGRSADALWAFVERARSLPVELVTTTPDGLEQSFAGHPVILRDGQRPALDTGDPKVVRRHPRTVIGWDDLGSTWLVVVDGRQGHSRGMTIAEVTDHLVALGARHAVNLDGGGSSTMVTHCPSESGWCLRNRPSDGAERAVPVALVVRPRSPQPPPRSQEPPPPPPPPEPAEPAEPAAPFTATAAAPVAEPPPNEPPAAPPAELAGVDDAGSAAEPDPVLAVEEPAPVEAVELIEAPETTVPAATTTTTPVRGPDLVAAPPMPVDLGALRDGGRRGLPVALVGLAGALVALDALVLVGLSGARGRAGLPSRPGSDGGSRRWVRSRRRSHRGAVGW